MACAARAASFGPKRQWDRSCKASLLARDPGLQPPGYRPILLLGIKTSWAISLSIAAGLGSHHEQLRMDFVFFILPPQPPFFGGRSAEFKPTMDIAGTGKWHFKLAGLEPHRCLLREEPTARVLWHALRAAHRGSRTHTARRPT